MDNINLKGGFSLPLPDPIMGITVTSGYQQLGPWHSLVGQVQIFQPPSFWPVSQSSFPEGTQVSVQRIAKALSSLPLRGCYLSVCTFTAVPTQPIALPSLRTQLTGG